MTTLHEYRENQPDKLLESLEITLTPEQKDYLKENNADLRTILLKKFNLKFGTTYSKLQLTRAMEVMKETKVLRSKPKKKRKRTSKNLYFVVSRGKWMVQFSIQGKTKTVGYYKDLKQAEAVVEEYRKKLA